MENKIEFTKNELKTFTKIYASNWNNVDPHFKERDYQGKGIDGKIEQFISDIRALKMRKETLNNLLLEFYHQGDANDTSHFVETICELFDYPV